MLGLLLGLLVVALLVSFVAVMVKGTGSDPLDKLESMRHPVADVALERQQALGRAQDFVTRFNTYGPQMLDSTGKMPAYEGLTQAMTTKFATCFDKNVPIAEATVKSTHVRRSAQVYAAGVSSIDSDTAQVIVGGVARFSYPNPKRKGTWVDFDPTHFRYVVSLDLQHGTWLVDDLDDIDDSLPPLGECSGEGSGGLPSAPTGAPTGGTR